MSRGSGSKKKSSGIHPRGGRDRRLAVLALLGAAEGLGRDRRQLADGDPLHERRDERVVDEHDLVDLLVHVRVGDGMGDRLGIE